MAKCKCGHLAASPVASLIKRHEDLLAVELAMLRVKCSACGKTGTAEATLLRLCEPGVGGIEGRIWRKILIFHTAELAHH